MFISFWVTALRHSAKISPRGERSFALPEKYQVVKAYNTRTSEVCRVVSENDFTSQSSIAGIIGVDSSCNRRRAHMQSNSWNETPWAIKNYRRRSKFVSERHCDAATTDVLRRCNFSMVYRRRERECRKCRELGSRCLQTAPYLH